MYFGRLAILAAVATAASATPLLVSFTSPAYTFSFVIDSAPTVDDFADTLFFRKDNISGAFTGPGGLYSFTGASVTFFSALEGGGLSLTDGTLDLLVSGGAVVYSGLEAEPVIEKGTYNVSLGPSLSGDTLSSEDGLLQIAEVPEPSTLLMGASLLGLAAVRARRSRAFAKG